MIVGDGQMALVLSDVLAVRGVRTTMMSPFAAEAERLSRERTSPRLPGFRLPDAVRVTATGCELLTRTPRTLFATPA